MVAGASRDLDKLADPTYLRAHGVVIVSESALQEHSEPIGQYLGHPIWGSVRFMGMEYRFDHVQDARKRERLAPGELFLEPGRSTSLPLSRIIAPSFKEALR